MKIQLEPDSASTNTHSLAQPSTSVGSRLVNLHLHDSELNNNAAGAVSAPTEIAPVKIAPAEIKLTESIRAETAPAEPVAEFTRSVTILETTKPHLENPDDKPIASTPILSLAAESSAMAETARNENIDTKALALDIAADYTAANLASIANLPSRSLSLPAANQADESADTTSDSVGRITAAVTDAIASIRTSTDPEDISAQLDSLKTFSDQIRNIPDIPELSELSDTIDKFLTIAEKSTGIKATRAAVKVSKVAKQASRTATKARRVAATKAATKTAAKAKLAARPAARVAKSGARGIKSSARAAKATTKTSARSAKNSPRAPKAVRGSVATRAVNNSAALRQALASVATMEEEDLKEYRRKARGNRIRRGIIAFGSATVCIALIIWFVATNIPGISVRVAALQTGVNASYPSYIPTEYSLSRIDTDEGKITLDFAKKSGAKFTLIEARSSWDSAALERNYVQPTWGENYSVTHEQGITIFINGSSAAWVNGGVLFKITAESDSLTKKQLRNIVTSM